MCVLLLLLLLSSSSSSSPPPPLLLLFARVFFVVVCFIGFHAFIFNRAYTRLYEYERMGQNQQFSVFFSFLLCACVYVRIWQWALKWMVVMIMKMVWCKMHYFCLSLFQSCVCYHLPYVNCVEAGWSNRFHTISH